MKRGWTRAHKYLSDARQRDLLTEYGVAERVLYPGKDWAMFVHQLREGDEAVIADLRIFGSRKALGEATAEIEAKGATLVVARSKVHIHPPTIREAHEAERKWAGERGAMGHRKRAKELSKRGHEAYRKKLEAGRIPKEQIEARWRNLIDYPTRKEAVAGTGWSLTKAWREFGPREQ